MRWPAVVVPALIFLRCGHLRRRAVVVTRRRPSRRAAPATAHPPVAQAAHCCSPPNSLSHPTAPRPRAMRPLPMLLPGQAHARHLASATLPYQSASALIQPLRRRQRTDPPLWCPSTWCNERITLLRIPLPNLHSNPIFFHPPRLFFLLSPRTSSPIPSDDAGLAIGPADRSIDLCSVRSLVDSCNSLDVSRSATRTFSFFFISPTPHVTTRLLYFFFSLIVSLVFLFSSAAQPFCTCDVRGCMCAPVFAFFLFFFFVCLSPLCLNHPSCWFCFTAQPARDRISICLNRLNLPIYIRLQFLKSQFQSQI